MKHDTPSCNRTDKLRTYNYYEMIQVRNLHIYPTHSSAVDGTTRDPFELLIH